MEKAWLIWDLDGTLVDSYTLMVLCIGQALKEFGVYCSPEIILENAKGKSVRYFCEIMSAKTGVPAQDISQRCTQLAGERVTEIRSMPNVKQLLSATRELGVKHYIFTHRGDTTAAVLSNNGLECYFDEVITGHSGFERKPNPDALSYLIGKYAMNKERTYYVGDRRIDVECAQNAGIKSILFVAEDSRGISECRPDYTIGNMMEILDVIGCEA